MALLQADGVEIDIDDDVLKFMSHHGRRIEPGVIGKYFMIAVDIEGGSSLVYVPAVPVDALGPEVVVSEKEVE